MTVGPLNLSTSYEVERLIIMDQQLL